MMQILPRELRIKILAFSRLDAQIAMGITPNKLPSMNLDIPPPPDRLDFDIDLLPSSYATERNGIVFSYHHDPVCDCQCWEYMTGNRPYKCRWLKVDDYTCKECYASDHPDASVSDVDDDALWTFWVYDANNNARQVDSRNNPVTR